MSNQLLMYVLTVVIHKIHISRHKSKYPIDEIKHRILPIIYNTNNKLNEIYFNEQDGRNVFSKTKKLEFWPLKCLGNFNALIISLNRQNAHNFGFENDSQEQTKYQITKK